MKLKEIDDELYKISSIANMISFDYDFSTDKVQKSEKLEFLDYLDVLYLNVLKKIEQIDYNGLNDVEQKVYNVLYKQYMLYCNVDSKEILVLSSKKDALMLSYEKAKKENNYYLLVNQLNDYLFCYRKVLDNTIKKDKDYYSVILDNRYFGEIDARSILDYCFSLLEKVKTNRKRAIDYTYDLKRNINIRDFCEKIGVNMDQVSIYSDNYFSIMPITNHDIKLTINEKVDDMTFLKGLIHESGHIMYLQSISEDIEYNSLKQPASLCIDEAIAKVYDYFIFESDDFIELVHNLYGIKIYKDICSLNRVASSGIYQVLHSAIRVILEYRLINGYIKVENLNNEYKSMYKKYLNIDIINDCDGVLADVQWYKGDYSYFVSYILAFKYAEMIYDYIMKTYNIKISRIEDLKSFREILKTFFSYGSIYKPLELINIFTNSSIDGYMKGDFFLNGNYKNK